MGDASQRARLLSGMFADIEVGKEEADRVSVLAVPWPAWKPFFERVVASRIGAGSERETSLELATSTLATLRSTN